MAVTTNGEISPELKARAAKLWDHGSHLLPNGKWRGFYRVDNRILKIIRQMDALNMDGLAYVKKYASTKAFDVCIKDFENKDDADIWAEQNYIGQMQ